jgi:hypothetical protein
VLLLVKKGGDAGALLQIAAQAVQNLTSVHTALRILLEPDVAAKLKHYHGVEDAKIHLFEARPCPGFGENVRSDDIASASTDRVKKLYLVMCLVTDSEVF